MTRTYSDEYRKKKSELSKGSGNPFFGKHHSDETKAKIRVKKLGKHLSEEHKQKLSIAGKGRLQTEETKQKLSQMFKGRPSPLKGKKHLTPSPLKGIKLLLTDEQRKQRSLRVSGNKNPMYGVHLSDEQKKKLSISLLGNKSNTGRKLTEEHKQNIRKGCKGINTGKRPPFSEEWRRKLGDVSRGKTRVFTEDHKRNIGLAHKGRITSEEQKQKLRITSLAFWGRLSTKEKRDLLLRQGKRTSRPQRELYEFLKQIFKDAKLEYPIQTKETIRFADIGVPSLKLDFEYDGQHWHSEDKDKQRDKELTEVGWATFRINKDSLKILSQQSIFTLIEKQKDIP